MSTVTQIKQLVHDLVDTSSSSFSDPRMIRGMNKAQDQVVNLIIENDTMSQWDDKNYTDLNEGFLNITANKKDYNIAEDENFADVLSVVKIFIKTSATGTEYVELPKTTKNFTPSTTTGVPTTYRISGRNVIFDITPNYTVANGMLVQFIRVPKPITAQDTTKELGIPSTYHHLVALITAYDYARAKRMDNRNDLLNEVNEEKRTLGLFISVQDKSTINRMTPGVQNNR